MKKPKVSFIDSHVHLNHIQEEHPKRIQWLKSNGCAVISWSYFPGVQTMDDLGENLRIQAREFRKLSNKGLACFYLAGVHPRNIPPDLKVSDVEQLLRPYFDDPLCLGIGEIGLETARPREKTIFAEQLAMGIILKKRGMRIGIHTPRENKVEITLQILSLLDSYPGLEDITVIDHCTPKTIEWVFRKGYWAGITLSPAKASGQDLAKITARYSDRLDRIMCNTDSGNSFYEDLHHFFTDSSVSEKIRNRFAHDNAVTFFNLEKRLASA